MRRIAIIGCSGAGKSTLALALADRLGLPVVHLDRLFWKPGWVESTHAEFEDRQRAALPKDGAWIADGNYGSTLDLRFALADTIIFLDLPTSVCLWRIVARRFSRGPRPDMAPGCSEQLEVEFLRYVMRWRRERRPAVVARLAELAAEGKRVITLTSQADVDELRAGYLPRWAKGT